MASGVAVAWCAASTDHDEIPGPSGVDFHRTISAYLNELIRLGSHLTEIAEPGLNPQLAAERPDAI